MGCGHMGWFVQQPDVHVAAVCDVDQNHLEAARQALGKSDHQEYGDFRELLARDDIDAVVIATPDHWHGLCAIAAARAGKDIYCEKPLTNSIGEGRAVCQAVAENQAILQTGSHERSSQGAQFARQLVQSGRLGQVHTVRIQLPTDEPHLAKVKEFGDMPPEMKVPEGLDYDFWLGHSPEAPYTESRCHFWWRFNSAYGGGEMTDRGCHVIDLAQRILGRDDTGPVSFQATGPQPTSTFYDAFLDFQFENRYADGLRMIGNNQGPRGVGFEGSDGKLFVSVHGGGLTAEPASLLADIEVKPMNPYAPHRREFLDAVKSRGPVIAPAEAGHRTATICHLNNLALRLGKSFAWDPVAEKSDSQAVNERLLPKMRSPYREMFLGTIS